MKVIFLTLLWFCSLTVIVSPSPAGSESGNDHCAHDSERWEKWMSLKHAYHWGVMYSNMYVTETLRASQEEVTQLSSSPLHDIPVFVHNKPSRTDRRAHTQQLLKVVGFSRVEFPPDGSLHELEEREMLEKGLIAREAVEVMKASAQIGPQGFLPYARHAIKQLSVIRSAAEANLSFFGVLEDDLMLAYPPASIRRNVFQALERLPPSADLLYLEMCFENCSHLCYLEGEDLIARSASPACSAAILYTLKGARRILELCDPVFHAIDIMLPSLISSGKLEAYAMTPPPFYQDGSLGSDVWRKRDFRASVPVAWPVCAEQSEALRGESKFDSRLTVGQLLVQEDAQYLVSMLEILRSPLPHQESIERSVRSGGGLLVLSDTLERWEEEELQGLAGIKYFLCSDESCEEGKEVGVTLVMRARRVEGYMYQFVRVFRRSILLLEDVAQVPCLRAKTCRMRMTRITINNKRTSALRDVAISTDRPMQVPVCFLLLNGSSEILKEQAVIELSSSPRSLLSSSAQGAATSRRLLLEGLVRFLYPLVRFSFIALCNGTSVQDGACAATASRCVEQGELLPELCSSPHLDPQKAVAVSKWSALSQLISSRPPVSFSALLDGKHMNNLHVSVGAHKVKILVYEGGGAMAAGLSFLAQQVKYVCVLDPLRVTSCDLEVSVEDGLNHYIIELNDHEEEVLYSSAGVVSAHPHAPSPPILLPSSVSQDVCVHFLSPAHDDLLQLSPASSCVPVLLQIEEGCLASHAQPQLFLLQNSKRIVDFELQTGGGGWQLWFPCVALEEGYNLLEVVSSSDLTAGPIVLLADLSLHVKLTQDLGDELKSSWKMPTSSSSSPDVSWILPAGKFSSSPPEAIEASLRALLEALDRHELDAEVIVVGYGEERMKLSSHPRVRLLLVDSRQVEEVNRKINLQKEGEGEGAACEEDATWADWNPQEERSCDDWSLDLCVREFLSLDPHGLRQWMYACRHELRCSSLPTTACCSCRSLLDASWPAIPGPSIGAEHLAVALNLGAAQARGKFLLLLPGATFFPHELFESMSTGAFSLRSFYHVPSSRARSLLADSSYSRELGTGSICQVAAEASPRISFKFVALLAPRQAFQVVGGLIEVERRNPLRYLALALSSWGYKSHRLEGCDVYTVEGEGGEGGYGEDAVEDYFYKRNEQRVVAGDREFLREESNIFSRFILQQHPPPSLYPPVDQNPRQPTSRYIRGIC